MTDAGAPLHACNGVAERQKVMNAAQSSELVPFSQADRRQSELTPAVAKASNSRRQSEPVPATAKAGNSMAPVSLSAQKRSAEGDANGARPAQRPRLVAQNGLRPETKVPPTIACLAVTFKWLQYSCKIQKEYERITHTCLRGRTGGTGLPGLRCRDDLEAAVPEGVAGEGTMLSKSADGSSFEYTGQGKWKAISDGG